MYTAAKPPFFMRFLDIYKAFGTSALRAALFDFVQRNTGNNSDFFNRNIVSKHRIDHFKSTLLRAATARALMASGLLPSLGIFHRNYYDAFPLADDIMEPYRPFVDQIVYKLHSNKKKKLDKEVKKIFLEMFYANVSFGEQMVQLGTCLTYTTASVAKFFMGETKNLVYPRVSCGS